MVPCGVVKDLYTRPEVVVRLVTVQPGRASSSITSALSRYISSSSILSSGASCENGCCRRQVHPSTSVDCVTTRHLPQLGVSHCTHMRIASSEATLRSRARPPSVPCVSERMLSLGSLSSLRAAIAALRGGGAPSARRWSCSAVGGGGGGGGEGGDGGSGFASGLGFGFFRSRASGLGLTSALASASASSFINGSLPPLPRLAAGLGVASVLPLVVALFVALLRARFLRPCASAYARAWSMLRKKGTNGSASPMLGRK